MGYINYKSLNCLEWTQTDEDFWSYNSERSARYALTIAAFFSYRYRSHGNHFRGNFEL